MRYLLDTHTLLFWALNPQLLSETARVAIGNGRSYVFVSAVSAIEIAIKRRAGKLNAPGTVEKLVGDNRFFELPIAFQHAVATEELPLIHKNPFDRILIAQARVEKLTLITRDAEVMKYGVPTLAA
jgi:PIN domain nuclease of toxin-antitoxin system